MKDKEIKIIVIGEMCEDIFVYGNTKRLSPEAPVPVFNPTRTIKNPGMSGNVVQNIISIDKKIKIIHWHQSDKIIKTRYVDEKSNHMFLRVDEGEDKIETFNLNEDKIEDIKTADAVIVSDYHKGFLSDKVLFDITKYSRFSIIDSKRKVDFDLINCFNFIKLNESEFIGCDINENQLNKILVTLGSRGAKHKNILYPSPDPKETIDVSGAGDTFTASFTLKYLQTGNIEQSIIFANKMASIVVSKRGVATP